jgi:hypothetical protein
MNTNNLLSEFLRWLFTVAGAIVAILKPTIPYILICTLMIFADCYTAWSLSRRAHKEYPDKVSEDGKKFNSKHFGAVIVTVLKAWVMIILAYLIQRYITNGLPVDMTKVAAGAICFWQLWSILENESSCNGARWAKLLQRILVDKTSRHFDIDLNELKGESN